MQWTFRRTGDPDPQLGQALSLCIGPGRHRSPAGPHGGASALPYWGPAERPP